MFGPRVSHEQFVNNVQIMSSDQWDSIMLLLFLFHLIYNEKHLKSFYKSKIFLDTFVVRCHGVMNEPHTNNTFLVMLLHLSTMHSRSTELILRNVRMLLDEGIFVIINPCHQIVAYICMTAEWRSKYSVSIPCRKPWNVGTIPHLGNYAEYPNISLFLPYIKAPDYGHFSPGREFYTCGREQTQMFA